MTYRVTGKRPINSQWTDDKEQFLISNYSIIGPKACGLELGMNRNSVATHAARLGLSFRTKSDYVVSRVRKGCGDISGHQWSLYRSHAKARKLEFNITTQEGWELFLQQNRCCAISGIQLRFPKDRTLSEKRTATASLDRIDSNKGYFAANCEWVHKKFQQMKMNMPKDDFINYCLEVTNFQKGKQC